MAEQQEATRQQADLDATAKYAADRKSTGEVQIATNRVFGEL